MRRFLLFAVFLAALAPRAEACMWLPGRALLFWDEVPQTLEPGEVVLELTLEGPVYPGLIVTHDDDGREEITDPRSIDCYSAAFHYSIKRVLAGDFPEDVVVIRPGFIPVDETLNPLKRRIIVGRVIRRGDFTAEMFSYSRGLFEASVLSPRASPDGPSTLASVYLWAEGALFWSATVIGGLIPGTGGTNGAGTLAGLAVLAAIIGLAAFLLRRKRRPKRNRPHS